MCTKEVYTLLITSAEQMTNDRCNDHYNDRYNDSSMHEATRRVLSVLLQKLEGFNSEKDRRTTLICATNRKKDLDAALLSRFDLVVPFPLVPSAAATHI